MSTRKTKKSVPRRRKATSSPKASKEVSADDVIRQLLELFDELGISPVKLATRVRYLKSKAMISQRLYPHIASIGELLTSWHQDPEYLDSLGEPLPIKLTGTRRSFRNLAKKSVPNLEPARLLSDLRKIGALSVGTDGLIRARMRALSVYEDKHFAVQHTLTSLDGFIKTLRHNLLSAPSNANQLFHRVARNGEFDPSQLQALKIRVRRQGQSFLESCDNWMGRRAVSSKSKLKKKPVQVSISVYLSID